MKLNVTYYGMIAESTNCSSEIIEIDFSEKLNLRAVFDKKHPKIKEITYKIAINNKISDFLKEENNEFEIALLPPFAGG